MQAQRGDNLHDRCKLRVPTFRQRTVERFTLNTGLARQRRHATRLRDVPERDLDQSRIPIFERLRQVVTNRFLVLQVLRAIEFGQFADFHIQSSSSAAICFAVLMSFFCVDLSPPHNTTTMIFPRRTK